MATPKNYDDMITMVQLDIQRIDAVLATGEETELKALHIELDGTYQNLIENWGSSTYNYIQGHGYTYEYIDEDTLRDNLVTIKGKLRGFLLQLSPNAEKSLFADVSTTKTGNIIDGMSGKVSESPTTRTNMYDTIKKRQFDVVREYTRIWKLFNTADHIGIRVTPLINMIDACLQFFPDTFKNRALSLDDFNDIYGFKFNAPNEYVTKDELISYCEYVITLCDHLWEYASFSLDDDADYLKDDLYTTVESCMDELGLVATKKDVITIYVDKDPSVLAVAELVDESLSYDVKAFIHKQTKGNLERKKTILKFLADEIEPKRKSLNSINKTLSDTLFQMFQKFVRHNNDKNVYISNMKPEELEACYDDIYQLWLLAKLEIDNVERKRRVKELLCNINTPTT